MQGLKVLLLKVLLVQCVQIWGKEVNHTLVIRLGNVSPDNFMQEGILINDQFPGPPIVVDKNDTLMITVVNFLPSNFTLHLHGILQTGTVEADGAPHVTQEPIPPNTIYTQRMQIGYQSGTFMYHAHTDLDLVWAFGPLIIRDELHNASTSSVLNYFGERTLILSQCWHEPTSQILDGLLGAPFEDVPDTSSLLINGRSWGVWNDTRNSSVSKRSSNRTQVVSNGYEVITVRQNETYRFRIIGMGVDSMLAFKIDNHTDLQVVEMDGILTDPVTTDYLPLNSAQRYSVLVNADQPIGNYWIRSEMLPGPGPANGRAILHYESAPDPKEMKKEVFEGESDELELDNWVLDNLHPGNNIGVDQPVVYPVPRTIDREIIVTSFQRDADGHTKFDINGRLHRHTGPSLLHEVLAGNDIISNPENGVYEIFVGESIQMIFENRMSDEGECEQHPWHMHGHTFYVVGQGSDKYDPLTDGEAINSKIQNGTTDFQFRDVVTLFPSQVWDNTTSGAPCGWTAVRFIADNPGLWLVHCHLTPHQIMGKWFVLYEHPKGKLLF